MTRALLKQNKNKDALKPYKNEKTRMETPKVPLKLHYGSRLPLKSLQSDSKIYIKVEQQSNHQKAQEQMRTNGKTMCTMRGQKAQGIQQYNQDTCYKLTELYPTQKLKETLEYHNEVRSTYATKREVR